jgi:hypothetical protein
MQALSSDLIESLFAKLIAYYGRRFLLQYEGIDADAVKAEWSRALAGFARPHFDGSEQGVVYPAIDWALESLPVQPPTLPEFRELCRSYSPPVKALPYEPKRGVNPQYRAALQRLSKPSDDKRPDSVRAADRFIRMWGCEGVKLTPFQRGWLAHARRVMAQWESTQQEEVN